MEYRTAIVPVELQNGLIVHVEATQLDTEEDVAFSIQSFAGVTEAIEGIAAAVTASVQKLRPRKSTIEFGLEVGIESGNLTALLAKGTGKANLKITLELAGE